MADENELEPNPCQTPVEVESVEVVITDDNTVTNHEQRNCKTKKKDQDAFELSELISKLSLNSKPESENTDSKSRTALVYDLKMAAHKNMFGSHPERPQRITRAVDLLLESGVLARVRTIASREVTRDQVLKVHTPELWSLLEEISRMGNRELHKTSTEYDSIYFNTSSFEAAKLAAGSLVAVTDEVLSNRAMNGVAVIRPPGHHCRAQKPMGFCLLGNVPIACRHAMDNYGLKRILVLDWDVHHGNGTEDMFIDDPRLLYISLHRYDKGTFYPGTGHPRTIGQGSGKGYNINIGWNEDRIGDGDYLEAFQRIVLPVALEYNPELVFISAGFDSGLGDPLGNCAVTSEGYAMMTQFLLTVSRGRVILALEGGYNLSTLANGIKACTETLLGDYVPLPHPDDTTPTRGGISSVSETIRYIAPHWETLRVRYTEEEDALELAHHVFETPPRSNSTSKSGECWVIPFDDPPPQPVPAQVKEETNSEERFMAELAQSSNAKEAVKVDESCFAVVPKPWCEHLETHVTSAPPTLDGAPPCSVCEDCSESWYCLTCYQPFCSRYVSEHGLMHALDTTHLMTLSMSDLSVWCYGCDAYVHNNVLLDVKNKGHIAKFGEPAIKIDLTAIREEDE